MKFGVREICDVVFKALDTVKIGDMTAKRGQPVLYIDSAKTSTIEGASSTVYAQGGRGNARLIAWEGEKTLTFTVEDALLSPIGFSILSGAGLFNADDDKKKARVHSTAIAAVTETDGSYVATLTLEGQEAISSDAPIFVMNYTGGSIGEILDVTVGDADSTTESGITTIDLTISTPAGSTLALDDVSQVFVDFYLEKKASVTELQIDAENFAGYYYVEASTLFRNENGTDMPAEIVFPKVKIQSNFTFNMASTGDPSTFTFTMDALPAYTMFNKNKKVLCAMQVIDDSIKAKSSTPVTLGGVVDSEIVDSKKNS